MESYQFKTTSGLLWAVRATREERSDTAKEMIGRGFKYVLFDDGKREWEEGELSVWDVKRKCWRRKIDYCMEHLGPKAVSNLLRSELQIDKFSKLLKSTEWTKKYRELLNKLTAEVQKTLGVK